MRVYKPGHGNLLDLRKWLLWAFLSAGALLVILFPPLGLVLLVVGLLLGRYAEEHRLKGK